jgi:hypothetical protein
MAKLPILMIKKNRISCALFILNVF